MKKLFRNEESKITLGIFIVTIIAACSPLFSRYCIQGHDVAYHLLRIESLKEGILMGKPFLKVNTLFFGNMGYASSMFYPDFLLYIPALLRVFGLGIGASFHIFMILCVILCYASSYFCGSRITGSKYMGSAAGILMVLSQYFLDDLLIRSAVGEVSAFIFLPFVIYGIYNAVYEDFSKPYLLAIGYGGVLLCHTLTFFMCILFGLTALIVKWKKFHESEKALVKLIATVLLTMLFTSPYWLTMVYQMINDTFYVSIPWAQPKDEALNMFNLFTMGFPAFGPLLTVFAALRVALIGTDTDKERLNFADWLAIGGACFLLFSTDIIPWERIGKYLAFVQFPWRFLLIASALFAFADMLYISCVVDRYSLIFSGRKAVRDDINRVAVVALMIIGVFLTFMRLGNNRDEISYYDYSDDYYNYVPYTAEVIAGEWLPCRVEDKDTLIDMCDLACSDTGEEVDYTRVKNTIILHVDESYEYVDVPFIYYIGYTALDADGNKLPVSGEGENGTVRVMLNGETGDVTVKYAGTWVQNMSYFFMALAVFITAFIYVRDKRKLTIIDGITLLTMILLLLSGCSPYAYDALAEDNVSKVADYSEEMFSDFEPLETLKTDTNELTDSVNDILVSSIGYEKAAKKYIALTEDGGDNYRVIALDDVSEYDNLIDERDGVYEELFNNVDCTNGLTEDRIIDLLMTYEMFSSSFDEKESERLLSEARELMGSVKKSYDYESAALIAMFAADYQGRDDKLTDACREAAIKIYNEISEDNEDAVNPVRLWAACELYRLTGDKSYREYAESIDLDKLQAGFSYENPGYLGILSYLKTNYKTDMKVSAAYMEYLLGAAIELTKLEKSDLFSSLIGMDEMEAVKMAFSDMRLLTLANSISKSIDYGNTCSFFLAYLSGMNPEGNMYVSESESCEPAGFVFAGQALFYQ